jgi:hypothetical protein
MTEVSLEAMLRRMSRLAEELSEYFARSPGNDVWINFRDLPEATRTELWEKHKSKLAFPAGLFGDKK